MTKTTAKHTLTTISAQIDAGFGNSLYIRGDGPGLSWEKGIAMDCVAGDKWVVTLSDATTTVTFKLMLHDVTWCDGDDYVVAPGENVTVVPSFHGAEGAAGTIPPF